QRIKADERIAATRGSVALRYGPLIYNAERADQSDISQPLSPAPLTPEWRGDLLGGVTVIKGQWEDNSPMLAIPNYARENRLGQVAGKTAQEAETTVNATSNFGNRPSRRNPDSIVWLKNREK